MTTPRYTLPQRSSKRFGIGASLLLIALAGCQPGPDPDAVMAIAPGSARGRDVVLITLDTTRRDHIGCYGKRPSPTPNIDLLCARGLQLDQALAVAPVTLPAHASMMTGRYPPRHGARYNGERKLADEQSTLAEALRVEGYQTAAFVSAFVLDRRFGLAQGFEHYDDHVSALAGAFASSGNERSASEVTEAALTYLKAHKQEQPLFLWLHYFDAHAPYLGHDLSADASDEQRYVAEISEIDRQIGRLLASTNVDWNDSLVMLLADHGESLGEHGERTHGLFVYDSTVAIPWIITAPGLRPRHSPALVSQVDLAATVLDALGVDPLVDIDGQSLLRSARAHGQSVYMETTLPYFDFRLSSLHALRTETGKYIEAPRPEFYQLATDPSELRNLLEAGAAHDAEAARLSELLGAHLLGWPAVDAEPDTADVQDASVIERLRSLGYLSGSELGGELSDPKDAVTLVAAHQQAAEAASAGRLAEAVAHLDSALEEVPHARGALYLRARLLASLGRTEEAIRDITQVNAVRPNADSLLLQAQLAVMGQRTDEASDLIAEAMRLDPRHGGVWIVRGDLAVVAKDVAAARAAYQMALQIDAQRVGRQAQARLLRLPK